MKAILYWTLLRDWGNFKALAVTSEGPRGRINGRFADNYPTHTTVRNCVGRFETQEAADAKTDEIKAIQERFKAARQPHLDAIHTADREEDAAIKAVSGATKAAE